MLSVLPLAALLAGCGGDDSDSSYTNTTVAQAAVRVAGLDQADMASYAAKVATLGNMGPTNPLTPVSTTTALPLEVLGTAGSIVTVQLPVPTGSTATKLWMRVNNLSYDGKGSVQINDGPWITLTNATVAIQGSGKYYGGIGGGFDTLKLTVPITGGVDGVNTIRFRFNQTDGISSGYRVLGFNLLDGNGTYLAASTAFKIDDPATWVGLETDTANIAAGLKLWQTATLQNSALTTSTIQAHCMDCHSANGSDLQRFNYSNYSIVTRAVFHGLTDAQGVQIASYIRSLSATLGVPGSNCRPWNPPYQPGPGLDSSDVKNWTCGAGLDAVSDRDADTLKSIFPNGITKTAIAPSGHLNAREIPISLQLPDWNHWLPRIHPKDAWGSYFTNSNLNKTYNGEGGGSATYNLRANLTTGGANYAQEKTGDFFNDLYYWGVEYGERFTPPNMGVAGLYTLAQQEKIYGTVQWQLVKSWELAQDFNLETNCPIAWTQKGAPASKLEARGWCGTWRFLFNVSPHALDFPPLNSMFGSPVAHYVKANQWYEMQLLLNPGNGVHDVHLPMDWQYVYGVIDNLSGASGRVEPARNLLFVVKGAQEMDNGVGVADVNKGWTTRDTSPLDVWKYGQSGIWKGTSSATELAVVNAYLSNWVDVSTSFDLNVWQRLGVNPAVGEAGCMWSIRSLCWSDYVPGTYIGLYATTSANFPSWAYTQIPQMRQDGVDGTQLNRFATWLNAAYPRGGFQALVQ
ncbi:hypothetical protein OVY01_17800 [Robbsia sp. Bb-Pol-6]|uniref:Cytochrome c domain-containing protein n=1 Tax=Robbsia betulipollinis TaxID=2981849 RepID=A0ABT3ZR26_9BURK|nr:hypothetical protein [Robbsia betulipollinis]MCY0389009.1 hypothetical protein [Robbsia betulipollinis]